MRKILLLLSFAISSIALSNSSDPRRQNLNEEDSLLYNRLDSICYYIDSLQIEHREYVLAQSLWETGWYRCDNCAWSRGNNLFGFKGKSGYIVYDSWVESVVAYDKWQEKRLSAYRETHSEVDYLKFLLWAKYATSDTYTSHVKYMYNWLMKNYF